MHALRRLLLPFSVFYGLAVYVRNYLFDHGILKSTAFSLPLIGIGNLTAGGTGKTPHVEYLIRLLRGKYKVATLSRGYGRETKGIIMVNDTPDTRQIGDEPMQYFTKFKDITVCVGEDRTEAITRLTKTENPPQVILMDDAFQHRKVKAGLNILLIEYDAVFKKDYFLPGGNMRESKQGIRRADAVIITKSPTILVPIERKRILQHLDLPATQQVFFSFLRYGDFNKVFGENSMLMSASYYIEKRFTILLVTGIANPAGLIEYLRRHTDKLEMILFPDHHEFSPKDYQKIRETFNNIANQSKIIVTTEKDAMRLRNPGTDPAIQKLPFFFLPVEVYFHQDEERFNTMITDYVRKNQSYNRLHTRKNQIES